MAGFVGGGGTWFIEAIYDTYSNYWTNQWIVTNQNATDKKVWAVNYGTILMKQRTNNLQIDNEDIKSRLRQTLTQISDFAFEQNLQRWREKFDTAKEALENPSPEEIYYHKDLIPTDNYSLTSKQSFIFGGNGMGFWWHGFME